MMHSHAESVLSISTLVFEYCFLAIVPPLLVHFKLFIHNEIQDIRYKI